MKTLKQIIEELKGMEVTDDFKNDVICAFEDYEFEGENEVIVEKDESNTNIDYQAYINSRKAPIICIRIEKNKVVDAWEA